MKEYILILALFVRHLCLAGQQADAVNVMEKSRELSIISSMNANLNLVITGKNGDQRNRVITMTTKSYDDGLEKRFIRFIEPADVRGTAMLVIDNRDKQDEMWIYLPALKKTRRIVTSEKGKSFMSSEFSNADMSTPAIPDFTYRHLEGSGKNNQWIIESIPAGDSKAEEYGYSKKISYIDQGTWQVKKMEFFDFDHQLFKTIEIKSVYQFDGGKYMIRDMISTNHINGRKSEIIFSSLKEGIVVNDSFFSLVNLER